MSLSSFFGRERDRELYDLRRQVESLSQAYNQASAGSHSLAQTLTKEKAEYNEAIASKERDMRVLCEENLALQGRIATIQKELQACKDDLFRLQPVSQLPDSTIAQRFEDLNVQIEDWIAAEIARSTDEHRQPGNQPKLFHHGENENAKAFLAKYPEFGGEYYVRSVLQQYLQQVLFHDTILLFALDRGFSVSLQNIENGMSQLKPSRGKHD